MVDFFARMFGSAGSLDGMQMLLRTVLVFFCILCCIRIAGRRSFGLRTPLDNIVTILLGALLSKAIVGSAPLVPVILCGFLLAVLHRLLAMGTLKSKWLSGLLNGTKLLVFANGRFLPGNMRRALVSERDILQGLRQHTGVESLSEVDKIYLERNGEWGIIKK